MTRNITVQLIEKRCNGNKLSRLQVAPFFNKSWKPSPCSLPPCGLNVQIKSLTAYYRLRRHSPTLAIAP